MVQLPPDKCVPLSNFPIIKTSQIPLDNYNMSSQTPQSTKYGLLLLGLASLGLVEAANMREPIVTLPFNLGAASAAIARTTMLSG
jgi:hypothetical protein